MQKKYEKRIQSEINADRIVSAEWRWDHAEDDTAERGRRSTLRTMADRKWSFFYGDNFMSFLYSTELLLWRNRWRIDLDPRRCWSGYFFLASENPRGNYQIRNEIFIRFNFVEFL